MHAKRLESGFTLIELLVVIAIIGILASLVLVSLSNARESARKVRIKNDIKELRTLAEVYNDANGGSYSGIESCFLNYGAFPDSCLGGIIDSVAEIDADLADAGASNLDVVNFDEILCIAVRFDPSPASEGFRYYGNIASNVNNCS